MSRMNIDLTAKVTSVLRPIVDANEEKSDANIAASIKKLDQLLSSSPMSSSDDDSKMTDQNDGGADDAAHVVKRARKGN